ncbi:MAG TPA: protein kinase [Pyrinomonadaceae bacterium]|nr:protein kinase [Pyrinomonadaceae bacterium]
MTPERWQKVKQIFHTALDKPAAERIAFIAQACNGDDRLREEVESLLASSEKDGSFIDSPAYEAAATLITNQAAELKKGTTLGAYDIVSFISRGGMGEVYLAHDRRLGRKVALKVLPSSFTKNQDRLRRFEQEARSASALNHPNIITIYEILKSESTHVIATEFVEGETLRHRLSNSKLEPSEALNIGMQVADALSAAHKAGIVHRDIKPENIMIRQDGYVKVLDFGLAKLSEEAPSVSADEAPTRQVRTGSGVIIGTAGYMSPEQARGKPVDARSDIFSLGAVIYEMVTHRKPFDGETPSDVLASILKTEPPPVSQLLQDAPPELTRIVAKALKKNREERYQVISDLLLDLKTLKEDLHFHARLQSTGSGIGEKSTAAATASASVGAAPTSEGAVAATMISQALSVELKRQRLRFSAFAVAGAVVLIAAGFGLYKLLNRPTRTHFQATSVARVTNSGKVIDARLSHDGTYLVYTLSDAGKQSLWIRTVTASNEKMIVPPAAVGIFGFTFSPDDREIFYVIKANFDAGTLYRIPTLGGTPQKLLERIDAPVTFAPDGKRMAFVRASFPTEDQSALIITNVDGTDEQILALKKKPDRFAPIFFTAPSWSPDGKLIATSVLTPGAQSRVIAFPVAGGTEINLSPEAWPFTGQVQWMPDMSGLILIAGSNAGTGAQLWFLSYPSGEKRQITNDLEQHRAIGLTADGTKFVNVVATGLMGLWVAPDGDASRAVLLPTGNVGWGGSYGNTVSWTPDGRIVFVVAEGNDFNLWISDADGENRKALTSNLGRNTGPVVSPDGQYVVFSSTRGGALNIWRMNIDGSNPKQLTRGVAESQTTISPDGRWIVYASLGTTRPTIWKVSIDGGEPHELTHRVSSAPAYSPDGQFVAYLYTENPDPLAPPNKIAIISSDGGEPIETFTFQAPGTIQTTLKWSVDGKSLLYTANTNNVTNIWSQPVDGGAPKQITNFQDSFMSGFAWTRDGKQLVCSRGIFNRDAVIVSEVK